MIFLQQGGMIMRKIFIVCCMMLFFSSVANAEITSWKDAEYDFSKIKTVVVYPLSLSPDIQFPFAEQKSHDLIKPKIRNLHTKYMNMLDAVNRMASDLNMDLLGIWKSDPAKFSDIYHANIGKYADAILVIRINQFGWLKSYVPASSYSYTTYQTSYFNAINSRGVMTTGSYQSPVENQVSTPGGYQDFPVASATFFVFDTKTENLIYGYTDVTTRKFNLWKYYNPDENMEAVIEGAFDKLPIK